MSLKILVATACGNKKKPGMHRAVDLYLSSRIRAVYNRKGGCDMAILSSRYGLVDSQMVIEDYDDILTPERAEILLPRIADYIKKYDVIVYFKAGASALYFELIREAAELAKRPIVHFGYGYMAEVNEIPGVILEIKEDPKILVKFHLNNVDIPKIPSEKVKKGSV